MKLTIVLPMLDRVQLQTLIAEGSGDDVANPQGDTYFQDDFDTNRNNN